MIVVSVQLLSAIDPSRSKELARMYLSNTGINETGTKGDYDVEILRGRDSQSFNKRTVQRRGRVLDHARLAKHVWTLVTKALLATGYGEKDVSGSESGDQRRGCDGARGRNKAA